LEQSTAAIAPYNAEGGLAGVFDQPIHSASSLGNFKGMKVEVNVMQKKLLEYSLKLKECPNAL